MKVEKELSSFSDFQISSLLHSLGTELALSKVIDADQVVRAAKAAYLAEKLPKLVEEGHFIILFSQWTLILDILEVLVGDYLSLSYLRLDGSTPVAERQDLVDAFNRGTCPIFLLSTRAGGLGLNLTRADTVIIHVGPTCLFLCALYIYV